MRVPKTTSRFIRKVAQMTIKRGHGGVPKTEKNQYRTVLLVSGRSLVSVLSQLQRSWNLTGCGGRDENTVPKAWQIEYSVQE